MPVVIEFECAISHCDGPDIDSLLTILFEDIKKAYDFCDHPDKFEELDDAIDDYYDQESLSGYGPIWLEHVLDRDCIREIHTREDDFDIDSRKYLD